MSISGSVCAVLPRSIPLPQSWDEAVKLGAPCFDAGELCPVCAKTSVFLTASLGCVLCSNPFPPGSMTAPSKKATVTGWECWGPGALTYRGPVCTSKDEAHAWHNHGGYSVRRTVDDACDACYFAALMARMLVASERLTKAERMERDEARREARAVARAAKLAAADAIAATDPEVLIEAQRIETNIADPHSTDRQRAQQVRDIAALTVEVALTAEVNSVEQDASSGRTTGKRTARLAKRAEKVLERRQAVQRRRKRTKR